MLVAELEMDCCMKMAAELRGWWRQKREDLALQQREPTKQSFMIPSPVEDKDVKLSIAEEKALRAQQCTDEGFKAGLKAALWACVFSTVPTLAAVRFVPWAKANINYTGQALIISSATISTYFVVTEQTMLECSRKGNIIAIEKSRAGAAS
ncbi:hypothetical protein M758_10G099200 [Ceratodon purpureus]|uniref:Early nodulin-93-like n=1 Tax=Ceratodon purpureus TaxID=3225 RepID=A0A8T0GNT1_CERPU|nr:hypothetical protein KC19_10G101300 [Ceratodon purpureus]KAG0603515.1 hypothetical protein M758_10G099200 [Ceratodon purpureus]